MLKSLQAKRAIVVLFGSQPECNSRTRIIVAVADTGGPCEGLLWFDLGKHHATVVLTLGLRDYFDILGARLRPPSQTHYFNRAFRVPSYGFRDTSH